MINIALIVLNNYHYSDQLLHVFLQNDDLGEQLPHCPFKCFLLILNIL